MAWRILMVLALASCASLAQAAEYTVSQSGKMFSSTNMTLRLGDRIIFVNDDDVVHNIFSRSGGTKFDAIQRPGDSLTVPFQSEGVSEVRCVFHPKMKLVVQVKK